MAKKSIYLIMVILFAFAFGMTSWAYWEDELKVRTDIPVVYEVSIEVEEAESKVEELTDQNTLESEENVTAESTENVEKSTKNRSTGEDITETLIESTKDDTTEVVNENIEETVKEDIKENTEDGKAEDTIKSRNEEVEEKIQAGAE